MRWDYMHVVALIFFAVAGVAAVDAYFAAQVLFDLGFTLDIQGPLGRLLFDFLVVSTFMSIGITAWYKAPKTLDYM